jgi:hypothetical protein
MRLYIGIEDLAANALIEVLSENEEKRFVTYKELTDYGNMVVQILRTSINEKAILIWSRDYTNALFRNYSDIFIEKKTDAGLGIALRDGVDVDKLIEKFRGYLAWDVLLAFTDERATSVLNK